MNAKNLILSLGVFLFVSIAAFALMPEDLWNSDLANVNHAQTPQVAVNRQQNRLARNNTQPPINKIVQGNVNSNSATSTVNNAVNSGIDFTALMQPVATNNFAANNVAANVSPNNQFSFAAKQGNSFAPANRQSGNNLYNNNAVNRVAFTNIVAPAANGSLAMRNGVVKNGVLQQAPQILSDAFPPATHNDGRNTQACSMCHQVQRTDLTAKERLTNNNNLANSIAHNYSGMIQKVTNKNAANGWNRVHIWVRSQSGDSVEIVTAPNWFLNFVGCKLNNNMLVKGVAFEYQKGVNRPINGQPVSLYAKNIIIDGQLCRLRGDKGLPLWSN